MGSNESASRASFQNDNEVPEPDLDDDDMTDTHRISISNKMVERLVEDATLVGGAKLAVAESANSPPPRYDHKDNILMEKLRVLDDTHSERTGITLEEVKATAKRIEMRTAHYQGEEPVCADYSQQIMECYNNNPRPQDMARCSEPVNMFSKCVQEATESRLRARTLKEAREAARRTRHMAHAREYALKDLAPEVK